MQWMKNQRAKMVDVVTPRTMPSESDVHVARNFLTKILRSSMRKSRFKGKNDPGLRPHSWHSSKLSEEERVRREATAEPDWQPKHEDRPDECTTPGEQEPQRHLTSHISLVSSMERLERPSQHPYTPDRISPTKYINTAEPIGKKDSTGFSCFSTGSSPPVHDQSTCSRKGTSTENIFFKGLQSEVERPRYLQSMLGGGGWEEQPSSRGSVVGRPGVNPLWQVPENKKSQSPPPPPTSQLRGDSFATTKVFPYSEGQAKIHGKSAEKLAENNDHNNGLRSHQDKTTSEARRRLNPLPTKDFLHPNTAADLNHNKVHPNKLFSLSSIDVRQSPQTQLPDHQRQYSDESPLYLHKKSAPPTKVQSVGSYYRSLQDLPTNAFSRKHARHSTTSVASCAATGGHNRQYSLMGKHSVHSDPQARLGKANSNEPQGFQSSFLKAKHSLPQSQVPFSENKERNGQSHPGNPGLHYDQRTRSLENAAKRGEGHSNDVKRNFPIHQSTDHKASSIPRQKDPWLLQEDHRISPLKTPLLHSLAQESRTLAERQQQQQAAAMNKAAMMSTHDSAENMAALGVGVKCNRRSDRYATTLRNEIQEKRAQLQKSRSAATLTCDVEEDEIEEWRSIDTSKSPGVSYSNTYKDNLKEAQARVLQATSFQRRDLGRLVPEATLVKTANGRVRGRKRLPLPKRTHSFSEPDKIDKVGVEGESQNTGSFGERRKFFEAKPAFSRPVLKSSQGGTNVNTDPGEIMVKSKEITPLVSTNPEDKQVSLEQQRLGTFAEYQATWNNQKKSSEVKAVGKYYSAENILDTEPEEKAVCIHERSRSSPSADFYAHNIPSPWRDPYSQLSTSRESTESMTLRYPADHHSPQSGLSVPKYEGLCVPGLADQTPKPDIANPSHTPTPHRLSSPNPSQLLPLTKGLLPPPPPKPHIGPKTTSSSQEFLSVAGADTPAIQPLSSSNADTQNHATNAGLSISASPGADTSSGGVEKEKEGRSALIVPADPSRSPSPQFAPQRLTDRPPAVSVQNDSPLRSDNDLNPPADMDVSSPVRKVPIKIIQSESGVEREGRAYLPQNTDTAILDLLPHIPSLSPTERPNSSLFSAFTRQASQDLVSVQESVCEEDTKREELARCIMGKDKSLADILDQSGRMTTMDLMEGLFPTEEQVLEGTQQRRRASVGSRSIDRKEEEDVSAAASLVPSSSYYNTSAPKAELLIKMKDMKQQLDDQDSEDELDIDLASKKQQLISSLARKLDVLREARFSLLDDVEDNDSLGRAVEGTVARRCRPNQLEKFRMFVGDLDKVVSLLLSLSGRLARVENALNGLEEAAPPEEKRTLTEKRKLLMRQHEDAKELKENLDRRERLVSGIMASHLDPESLDDYRHFVKMKSALIIEQRKLEDKIKLGEEQLKCLVDSLPLDQRLLF